MVDFDEIQMAKLARELVMNIRNYKETFTLFGIDENDYQIIEKNEYFRKVRDHIAIEWNSTLSTEERIRFINLAYYEQLSPVLARRAMAPDANLSASTDVGKLLMKGAGIGEAKSEKVATDRFVITINLGADTEGKLQETAMAKLSMRSRNSLASSSFALPGKGKGPSGKGSGSYPIPDKSHARNALARASGKAVEAKVRAKVKARFPDIGKND